MQNEEMQQKGNTIIVHANMLSRTLEIILIFFKSWENNFKNTSNFGCYSNVSFHQKLDYTWIILKSLWPIVTKILN